MVGAVLTRPAVDAEAVAGLLASSWRIVGELRPLPSERDLNFAVRVEGVDRFVIKVSNLSEDPPFLQMQHAALALLAGAGVPCQQPVASTTGETVLRWAPVSGGVALLVRVLTWLPGRPLSAVAPAARSATLLEDLGTTMGRTARALGGFDHPAAHRTFQWEASQGLDVVRGHAAAVTDPDRAALLARWQERLAYLVTVMPALRHGVIHNDANDNNVLVSDDGRSISGLLDLGDAVHSIVVNELAVAAAYAALDAPEPLGVIDAVRRGFERELPLTTEEFASLVDLVALRLCTSVALSAHQSRLAPDDPYLTISERPAWNLLAELERRQAASA
ncbi:MAG TPA: phosphotransferase [Candidatus Limnocylindrales bacterium]|nr:phosphotransferase [Candidatus Limnocylindrales bacterium]